MLRTALLWGNTINLDSDYSKYIETISDPWVIEGFAVEEGKVKPGKAWVKVTRSNGESLFVLVQNTQDIPVSLNGDVFIGIEVAQNAIDNGLMNNEEGTGIASIKVWPQKPNQNYLLLAVWQGGRLSDKREIIPKLQSLSSRTTTLEAKVQQTEGKVEKLEEAGTPSYLGIIGIVWEKYTMQDTLFLQNTPTLTDSTIAINVGDSDANREQHIQRMSNGVAGNQLKLKMDKVLSPTSSMVIEVRKGIKVEVNEREAYWYWGWEVLATATLPYTKFSTEAQEITVDLNKSFQLPKGNLYSVIVMQQGGIVNANNYYRIYCDSTQYSEAFSVVAVNGSNRVRSKLMPYCVSDGFESLLSAKKVLSPYYNTETIINDSTGASSGKVVNKTKLLERWFSYLIRLKSLQKISPSYTSPDSDAIARCYFYPESNGQQIFKTISKNDGYVLLDVPIQDNYNSMNIEIQHKSYGYRHWNQAEFEVIKIKSTIAPMTRFKSVYPHNLAEIGGKVECVSWWLFEGKWVGKENSIVIDKTLTGDISTLLSLPDRWLLQVYCKVSGNSENWGKCMINGNEVLAFTKSYSHQTLKAELTIYVEGGEVKLQTQNNNWEATMIIKKFIPL